MKGHPHLDPFILERIQRIQQRSVGVENQRGNPAPQEMRQRVVQKEGLPGN